MQRVDGQAHAAGLFRHGADELGQEGIVGRSPKQIPERRGAVFRIGFLGDVLHFQKD